MALREVKNLQYYLSFNSVNANIYDSMADLTKKRRDGKAASLGPRTGSDGIIELAERLVPEIKPIRFWYTGNGYDARNEKGKIRMQFSPNHRTICEEVGRIIGSHFADWSKIKNPNGPANSTTNLGAKIIEPRSDGHPGGNIRMTVQRYSYFEKLATRPETKELTSEERSWLRSRASDQDPLKEANPYFANPIALNLLLITNDGIVQQRRSGKTITSSSDKLGLSVSEGLDAKDLVGGEVDIIKGFKRGLKEELGITSAENIRITSLTYDSRRYEYVITAVAQANLSKAQVMRLWKTAADGWEGRGLVFNPVPRDKDDAVRLVEENKDNWTTIAKLGYLAAFTA